MPSRRWRVEGHDSLDAGLQPVVCTGLLSPRSQQSGGLQPPLSPVLADIAAQLKVLMASVQSIATTVGQLGSKLQSLQAEVTEMKSAENEDAEFEEHDGFPTVLEEEGAAVAEAVGQPKFNSARHAPHWVTGRRSGGPHAWLLLVCGLPCQETSLRQSPRRCRQGAWAR